MHRLKKFELIRAIRGKESFVSFVKNLCESLWLKKMSNKMKTIPHINNLQPATHNSNS